MVFLTIVNFYGCSNNKISSPFGNNAKSEISFSYLDDKYQISDKKMDKLLMNIKEVSDDLILISEKTKANEYRTILIYNRYDIYITMIYKEGKEFPAHISFHQGDNVVRGTTTEHYGGSFGVAWLMDGEIEYFRSVKLSEDIYNYKNISYLDSKENYQAKTIMISLKILYTLNNYAQESVNQSNTKLKFTNDIDILGKINNSFTLQIN